MKTKQEIIIEQRESLDNLIVTFVKMYPQNLTYAFQRVADIKGKTLASVSGRYYTYVRWKRKEELFTLSSDQVKITNTKSQITDQILKQLEDQA